MPPRAPTFTLKQQACFVLFLIAVGVAVAAIVGEIYVRRFVLTREFLFYTIEPDRFPFYRLKESFDGPQVRIRHGRRETLPRGERARKLAFVGDSVTFCQGIPDADCFVEVVQASQNDFDAYNFGVPGYGLPEVEEVARKALAATPFESVVYTFNYNDLFDAMPVLLSLLQRRDRRVASWDDYAGARGKLKLFVKDHFKTPFVLQYHFGIVPGLSWSTAASSPGAARDITASASPAPAAAPVPASQSAPATDCHAALRTQLRDNYGDVRTMQFLRNFVGDEGAAARLRSRLSRLAREVESRGSKLVLAPTHPSSALEERFTGVNELLKRIAVEEKIPFVDTHPLYARHYAECDFFLKNDSHLGAHGNRLLAAFLAERLR